MPKVEKQIVVNAPRQEVYDAWRNFENFPRFMSNIEEVRIGDARRSHWKAKGPLGIDAEWEAELTLDEPAQAVGWRSVEGESSVTTAGRVNFEDVGSATRLDVTLHYDAPAGALGNVVAKIFANPEHQVEEDLERFKSIIEQGWEASGLARSATNGGQSYGSSMGGTTESEIAAIADDESVS